MHRTGNKTLGVGVLSTCSLIIGWASNAVGADRNYEWYDLGYLGDYHFRDTNPSDLNDQGAMAGTCIVEEVYSHACAWENGTLADLFTVDPEVYFSLGVGISEQGQISGAGSVIVDGVGTGEALVYDQAAFTVLPVLDPCNENDGAGSFSPSGQYVIGSCRAIDGSRYPILHDLWNGIAVTLGSLPDAPADEWANAYGVNDDGIAVGRTELSERNKAFIYSDGVMTEIVNTIGGTGAEAFSINNKGTVVGGAEVAPENWHAMMVKDGIMEEIGSFDPRDVNEREQIVGEYVENFSIRHAVLYEDGDLIELNPFLPDAWTGKCPVAINNYGWIVGSADDGAGRTLGWLLVPLYNKGDYDGDSDVDLHDFGHFQRCYAAESYQGPEGGLHVGCSVFDFDDDVDLDLTDFDAFQAAFTGAITSGW